MSISRSTGIAAGVLALTIGCAGAKAAPIEPQQQSSAASSTPAAGPLRVSKSVLERYVGEYPLNPQVTAVIRVQGENLVREIMGQQQILTPISETRFKLGAGEAQFEVDKSGAVTMIVSGKRYPRKP
jgi:hypothetical protein